MRKKVNKTIKASDDDTVAQLCVAASSHFTFLSTRAPYDDTVAQSRVGASSRSSFSYTPAESTNNSFH
jgi:hypothetical protein